MHGSPPQTPGRLSIPGKTSLKSVAAQRNNCAFSDRVSFARISSACCNALIGQQANVRGEPFSGKNAYFFCISPCFREPGYLYCAFFLKENSFTYATS